MSDQRYLTAARLPWPPTLLVVDGGGAERNQSHASLDLQLKALSSLHVCTQVLGKPGGLSQLPANTARWRNCSKY